MSIERRPSFAEEIQPPIVGRKLALLVSADNRVRFAPRYPRRTSGPYDADADAVCENSQAHTAPSANCRCGFHAVASRAELWRLGLGPEAVVLDVELSGTVIEHEFGWRAGHQSVLGVHVPELCTAEPRCRRPAVGLAGNRGGTYDTEMSSSVRLRAVCERCSDGALISVADLAGSLGVEVTTDCAHLIRDSRKAATRRVSTVRTGRRATPSRPSCWRSITLGIGDAFASSVFHFVPPPSAVEIELPA